MARSTVYNQITNEENIAQINPDNVSLMEDFLDYLTSIDRSPKQLLATNQIYIYFSYGT